jgi:hypothetical protein
MRKLQRRLFRCLVRTSFCWNSWGNVRSSCLVALSTVNNQIIRFYQWILLRIVLCLEVSFKPLTWGLMCIGFTFECFSYNHNVIFTLNTNIDWRINNYLCLNSNICLIMNVFNLGNNYIFVNEILKICRCTIVKFIYPHTNCVKYRVINVFSGLWMHIRTWYLNQRRSSNWEPSRSNNFLAWFCTFLPLYLLSKAFPWLSWLSDNDFTLWISLVDSVMFRFNNIFFPHYNLFVI